MAQDKNAPRSEKRMSFLQHFICGWPIGLVAIGGAIGGGLGGAAYGINLKIFSSELSSGLKYLLVTLVGIGAVGAYFLIILILAMIWPGIFGS